MRKEDVKNKVTIKMIIATLIIVAIGIVSFVSLADKYSNPETYSKTIVMLDEKRDNVLAMSAASAAVSTGLTLLPNDMATPVADNLADLSSTFMFIMCVILLEKYMLAFAGLLTFKFLIPIACCLGIVFIYNRKEVFRIYALKIALLGICIVVLVPISSWATSFIEETYSVSIEKNIKDAEETAKVINQNQDKSENAISKLFANVKNGISNLSNKVKKIMGNFIEAAAILIVTSCIIPILTLWLFVWLINMILGINIKTPMKKMKLFARGGSKIRHKVLSRKADTID